MSAIAAMRYCVIQTRPEDRFWRHIERHSPQTVGYMADPKDEDDYHCFIALDAQRSFAGLSIVAIGRLGFGPLADQTVGCLENIFVPAPYRRQGIGSTLFQKALVAAWQARAVHVWWTIDYGNSAAIAFYVSRGAVFIAEEDPASDNPEKYYTVVIANPDGGAGKPSANMTVQRTGASRSGLGRKQKSRAAGSRRSPLRWGERT
jgi:GNAT superfamily N-acetyltransferase